MEGLLYNGYYTHHKMIYGIVSGIDRLVELRPTKNISVLQGLFPCRRESA